MDDEGERVFFMKCSYLGARGLSYVPCSPRKFRWLALVACQDGWQLKLGSWLVLRHSSDTATADGHANQYLLFKHPWRSSAGNACEARRSIAHTERVLFHQIGAGE